MKIVKRDSQSAIEIEGYFGENETDGEFYVAVTESCFLPVISSLSGKDIILIGLFCAENFEGYAGFTLFYVLEKRGSKSIVVLLRRLNGAKSTSIAMLFPSAVWSEREITDGFGIDFTDAFDKRRLFLHEVYPADFHPLLKSFANRPVEVKKVIAGEGDEYQFKKFVGEGVYQIPVGPVHAGIIEPGHFRFSVIGETIYNLEIRMFYKHRGVEKLAEGKKPEEGVVIAESISGDESVANATAFSMAIEKIAGSSAPERAWELRTILLEMERIYSHLGDIAGMVLDVAYPTGASRFFILREELLRRNELLTGSRFMKGIIAPGGLKKDIPAETLGGLSAYLVSFLPRFESAVDKVLSTPSVIDRLETTGVIKKELVNPLNITGPAARAAGAKIDVRFDHPYGIYSSVCPGVSTAAKRDVLSRFNVKAQEIVNSVSFIRLLIAGIKPGEVFFSPTIKDGYCISMVESARGQDFHWVYLKNGVIDRYKVRTASFYNWLSIEHAVMGNIVPDFPLINKSLNLSYAGTDL